MRTRIGLLSMAGFLGVVAAAEAASPFDGTYQFASSAKVNETYISPGGGTMGWCQDRTAGPFTIVDGLARYTTQSGDNLSAQVAPNGEFEMRHANPDGSGSLRVLGQISANGRVYARQIGNSCSHDFGWQKQSAPPSASASQPAAALVRQLPTQTVKISGTIETIDDARQVVNIKTADGKIESINVPLNVKQFDQLKVGDKVSATYHNTVSARLKSPDEPRVDTIRAASSMGQEVQSGGTAAMVKTMTVTVRDVDKNASSISVDGPNGWQYSRRIADPTLLDQIKVGDRLDITWDTNVTLATQ